MEGDTAYFFSAVARDTTPGFLVFAVRLEEMVPVGQEPGVFTLLSQSSIEIVEDCPPWCRPEDSLPDSLIEIQVADSDRAATRVSVIVMPAMGASAKRSSMIIVEVVELDTCDAKVLGTCTDNTLG